MMGNIFYFYISKQEYLRLIFFHRLLIPSRQDGFNSHSWACFKYEWLILMCIGIDPLFYFVDVVILPWIEITIEVVIHCDGAWAML